MKKFRKKPVEVEAMPVSEDAFHWIGGDMGYDEIRMHNGKIWINTLEGTMRAEPGDWIIRGVNGEFYPCKPDIFEQTYDEVPDDG